MKFLNSITSIYLSINLFILNISSFQLLVNNKRSTIITLLNAKSKKESSKGFGKVNISIEKPLVNSPISETLESDISNNTNMPVEVFSNEESMPMKISRPQSFTNNKLNSKSNTATISKPKSSSKTQEEVFAKYGIIDSDSSSDDKTAVSKLSKIGNSNKNDDEDIVFGKKIIDKLPVKTQTQFDSALVTLTFVSLTFVVITGIAISFGAFKLVYPDVAIDANVDNLVTNIIAPAFTPALGIFFFFSISYGLFKFAQISSSETVYKE